MTTMSDVEVLVQIRRRCKEDAHRPVSKDVYIIYIFHLGQSWCHLELYILRLSQTMKSFNRRKQSGAPVLLCNNEMKEKRDMKLKKNDVKFFWFDTIDDKCM